MRQTDVREIILQEAQPVIYRKVNYLKTVANYNYDYEAELAKGYLEAEGINVVKKGDSKDYFHFKLGLENISLFVPDEDYERACNILGISIVGEQETLRCCPKCGTVTPITRPKSILANLGCFLSIFLIAFPSIPFFTKLLNRTKRKCPNCGNVWVDDGVLRRANTTNAPPKVVKSAPARMPNWHRPRRKGPRR